MIRCPSCEFENDELRTTCAVCETQLGRSDVSPTVARQLFPSASRSVEERALRLLSRGRKIQAIKIVRQETNLGLKEAKDMVEELARRRGMPVSPTNVNVVVLVLSLGLVLFALLGFFLF